ncbi:MAG: cell wall hydrolase [Pseudomonadota bacterium]
MTLPIRSAIVICAALATSGFAPAQAGPTETEQLLIASATLPKVAIPDLLGAEGEPDLAGDAAVDLGQDIVLPQADVAPQAAARPTGDLSSMVAGLRASEPGSSELECLATGVYFESKSEPLDGQLAVGKVIANRSKSGRFPSSYCGVLFQRGQFSFVRGKSFPSVPRASKQWKTAVAIAKIIDQGLKDSAVGNALFFHARYVSPGWRLKRVASIGNHIFYR